jgi:F-type H+-transporting ATPase subunit delta
MADPGIAHSERTAALERIFKGRVDPLIWNFIGVLNYKNRLGSLGAIIDAYKDLLEDKLGRIEVDLTVAQPLAEDQLATAQQKISAALGKEAVMHTYVDESIIGGVVVRVDDKLIDASVRHQLQAMKQQMLAKMPK